MPTLDDLRAVLYEREKFAGDPDVVRQFVASPPRRRVVAPALAAAAVVALAVGGIALAGRRDNSHEPAGGSGLSTPPLATTAPPNANATLHWGFSIGDVAGYRFNRFVFDAESQLARITNAGDGSFTGFATMYSPSVSPKTLGLRVDTQQQVLVGTADAIFVPGISPDTQQAAEDSDSWPRLIWHYRADAWAEISGPFGYVTDEQNYDNPVALSVEEQIAEAVQVGDSDPITMPFAVEYVPSEFAIASATSLAPACLGYDLAGAPQPLPADVANLSVCRVATNQVDSVPREDGDQVAVHDVGDGTSVVCVLVPDGLSPQDLQDLTNGGLQSIADHADTSPKLADPSTWLPVD